jgi:hypothetical protein
MSLMFVAILCVLPIGDSPESKADSPKRPSTEAAAKKVAEFLRKDKPTAPIGDSFPIKDLTTDTVWNRLAVQVVKSNDPNIERSQAFVIRGDEVFRIGRAFGGDGVNSLVVVDLVGDKKPLLVYSFAWGSGEHRSQIAVFDLHGKAPQEHVLRPANFSMADFVVRSPGAGKAELLIGDGTVGRIVASRTDGELTAEIELIEDLPAPLRKLLQ